MLIELDLKDLPLLYEWLLKIFPKEEVKPLSWLEKMVKERNYTLFGKLRNDHLVALALCYTKTQPALLDYFAVLPANQASGIGSEFLRELENYPLLSMGLIVETESLAHAKNDVDLIKRKRRILFYERLDYRKTSLEPTIFGTTYTIYLSKQAKLTDDELKHIYKILYFDMVPENYHHHLKIK